MAVTKSPSGLSIARNGMKFTFSWKISDADYGTGQKLQYRTNLMKKGVWSNLAVGVKTTSKTVALSAAAYWPTTKKKLTAVTFRVCGCRKAYETGSGKDKKTITPTWCSWVKKTYEVKAPAVPKLTAALDSELSNRCKFTWNAENDAKIARHFYRVKWESILVTNSNVTAGKDLKWKSTAQGWDTGTGAAAGSVTKTEDTDLLAVKSYTRWVRVKAQGARGDSDWRYAKHVYAIPYKGVIKEWKTSNTSNLTTVMVKWEAKADAAHPIDRTAVEWVIDTPEANRVVPGGADWDEANVSKDTTETDSAKFTIDNVVGTDQCLWVRIKTQHDDNIVYGSYQRIQAGPLASPQNISVETNDQTFRATITAENASEVPDSCLAVIYRTASDPEKDFVIGVIPSGETSVTVQCPDWSAESAVAFGVYAFQGSYIQTPREDGVTAYAVTPVFLSETVWRGGSVPNAPGNLAAVISADAVGEVTLTWDWTWAEAENAELSWSQNPNAWESTDEPETYVISNLHASKWRVSDLETGVTWYFRARLGKTNGEDITWGPYTGNVTVDLSSAPSIPVLSLSSDVITAGGSVTATWAYTTTDGTAQAYAEICEATVDGEGITYGDVIAHATGEQHAAISSENWQTGETYHLCVRVTSASGQVSDGWSAPVSVHVAEPMECAITSTSLVTQQISDDDGEIREATCLTVMPLSATVTGAGEGGTTTLIIERAAEYHVIRPDETERDGFEGETIALYRQTGEDQISITEDDLIGLLDDGAAYRLIAVVEDGLGQSAEAVIDFEVHWNHQAGIPSASAEAIGTAVMITPAAPEEYVQGDVCDIYRLSADKPELIIENGQFGTTYVDPYPAIGDGFGHRIVHRTSNGDYITADNQPAWIDTEVGGQIEDPGILIDFSGNQINLPYDIGLSNKWDKDFQLTSYLGGSQQGDWNPAVTRTGTYTTTLIAGEDEDKISGMRALAAFPGICHVRTPDGSSFPADIQVSESKAYTDWEMVNYSLVITRVDPEELDGMTLEEWDER